MYFSTINLASPTAGSSAHKASAFEVPLPVVRVVLVWAAGGMVGGGGLPHQTTCNRVCVCFGGKEEKRCFVLVTVWCYCKEVPEALFIAQGGHGVILAINHAPRKVGSAQRQFGWNVISKQIGNCAVFPTSTQPLFWFVCLLEAHSSKQSAFDRTDRLSWQ